MALMSACTPAPPLASDPATTSTRPLMPVPVAPPSPGRYNCRAMTTASEIAPSPLPAGRSAPATAARSVDRRSLVALARLRLRGRRGRKAAAWLAVLLAGGGAVAILAAALAGRGATGPADTALWVARTSAWLCGGLVALSAAGNVHLDDRRDGAEALVLLRGGSPRTLESARVLAAMIEVGLVILLPAMAVSLLAAALAGSPRAVLGALTSVVSTASFAVAAGVVVGGLAALCGRYGAGRGRWILAATVLGPWILMDALGEPGWSIPGALQSLLTILEAV